MIGKRFGKLIVVADAGASGGRRRWLCKCDCGTEKVIVGKELRRPGPRSVKSCGCLKAERARQQCTTHGMYGTLMHKKWRSIIERCENPNHKFWARYGGRGIRVCARWRGDVRAFAADVGSPPSPRHSIDRIDNNRGYDCGKCADCVMRGAATNWRWATPTEQNRNTVANRLLTFRGEVRCMAEWASIVGIDADRIQARLGAGWPVERALTRPVGSRWRVAG